MLSISEHAIDRFIERAYKCSRDEAKEKIYSLVIDRYVSMPLRNAKYPLSINNLYAVVKNNVVVTITKFNTNCKSKPTPKNKKKWKGK